MSIHRETDPKYEVQAKLIIHLLLSSHRPWGLSGMANLIDPTETGWIRKRSKTQASPLTWSLTISN